MSSEHNVKIPAAELFAAGIFLVYAALLLFRTAPPSLTDYADWTYQGVLLRNHVLGIADPFHQLKHYPVPNSTETVGIAVFALLCSWKLAAKLWLCVQLGFSFFTLRALVRTSGAAWPIWIIAPAALFFNVSFWYGFMNFQFGLCWVLWFTAMLLMRVRSSAGEESGWQWPLALVLIAAFFTHMIPCAFCGLLLLAYSVQTRRWRVLINLAPVFVLTLWYIAGRFLLEGNADGQTYMQETAKPFTPAFFAFKANTWLKSFGSVNPHGWNVIFFGHTIFLLLFVLNFVLACIVLLCFLRSVRQGIRRGNELRFFWASVLLLVPFVLLLPGKALGVSDPGARLLQTVLAPTLVLLVRRDDLWMKLASIASLALSLAGLVLFQHFAFSSHYSSAQQPPKWPRALLSFTLIPNDDQDLFYRALERGDLTLEVFPTGMLLNRHAGPRP
ncbi:MAG: hypothetical protein PW735_05720 [Acidobacteriaceae bacterium]|nr:hypothetical protein [Acidobacteriaceae bacterium]